ncbi:MAG: DUF1836 domain-containing protein [Lachnospiraceae bacterium]|nr:DUF1836 domain-containing protein [Lachnospiraceae bacterium]
MNLDEYFEKVVAEFQNINHINPKDLPNIDLYMDQVTTFMDTKLTTTKRREDDKILTKTMINNYAKNDLLPAPVKKKYSKDHMLTLIFIYYFKHMLSITDIQTLLKPISDKYFGNKNGLDLDEIYKVIYANSKRDLAKITEEVKSQFEKSKDSFTEEPDEDREYLQLFTFLCSMAFEVYIKKHLIEQVIDGYFENYESPEAKDDKKAQKKDSKKDSKKK